MQSQELKAAKSSTAESTESAALEVRLQKNKMFCIGEAFFWFEIKTDRPCSDLCIQIKFPLFFFGLISVAPAAHYWKRLHTSFWPCHLANWGASDIMVHFSYAHESPHNWIRLILSSLKMWLFVFFFYKRHIKILDIIFVLGLSVDYIF